MIALVAETLDARARQVAARKWEAMLPPAHGEALRHRYRLRSLYVDLTEQAETLSVAQATSALASVRVPNYYNKVLSGAVEYRSSLDLTEEFVASLRALVEFAFTLLGQLNDADTSELSIRDALYRRVYEAMPAHFCPFCGIDRFDAPHPDMPRHSLDHYLPISLYPMFGIHLPNLVPMCERCNSRFKGSADILTAEGGGVRRCVDPYGGRTAKISLMQSSPFGAEEDDQLPVWVIQFDPDDEVFETWDEVFDIRLRYRESLLKPEYKPWLEDFGNWVRDSQLNVADNQAASDALRRWATLCDPLRDLGFVKRPMFEMLSAAACREDKVGGRLTRLVQLVSA